MLTRLVLAHPLPDSLNARLAAHAAAVLQVAGHQVQVEDLYAQGFDPRLSVTERREYYSTRFVDQTGLAKVEGLVLVFPTWWFGLPAILKGWIDRSFLPGVAYEHADKGGAMVPRLTALRHVVAITTLGAPAWYDLAVARQPVRRSLKWGVVKPCAPKARFTMLSLHNAETATAPTIARYERRIDRALARAFPTRQGLRPT